MEPKYAQKVIILLDPEKMKALPRPEFHVDAAQAHATLALGCMRLWLSYVEKYMP